MFKIKSSLGSFLRRDLEDWTGDWYQAAVFPTATAADGWITANYGRNGHKFFRTVSVRQDDEDEDYGDMA